MIESKEDNLLYITMKKENVELYKSLITKVGNDSILLFDIDETLYKSTEKTKKEQSRIYRNAYNKLLNKYLITSDDIKEYNKARLEHPLFYETLHKHFGITQLGFENLKEPVDYGKMAKSDPGLRKFLLSVPVRKWAFTNGLKLRAHPILKGLGLTDCFEGVICFSDDEEYSEVIAKPKDQAYRFVEELLQIENKTKVFFFDDHIANIETGRRFGWNCYHVGKEDDIILVVSRALGKAYCQLN